MRRGLAAGGTALLLLLGACGIVPGGAGGGAEAGEQGSGSALAGADGPVSALQDMNHPSFPEPLIDPDEVLSGGPPPDGIPPIDDPKFQPASEVDWLEVDEPVLSLTVGEETRAYPLRIMTWHEIVNDTVGGLPVAVTYCPLCNSGVAFDRTVEGEPTTFGTSGRLYADNLVMYDRRTESLWPQLTGRASIGVLTGTQLDSIPMGVVGWTQFREQHPDATVLTRETGHQRDYGRNPYVGYDDPDGDVLFALPGDVDARLPVKARVVGIERDGEAVALSREALADAGSVAFDLAGTRLVAWHVAGQRSALDESELALGSEIGSVAVFEPRLEDGRELGFTAVPDGFVDDRTGSTWNIFGVAVAGPLAGARLPAVTHLDTFWFAWAAFQPDTRLIEP